jgi:DNA polymerase-3 subunit epsilon
MRMKDLNFLAIDFETANHDPTSACAVGLCKVRNGRIAQTTKYLIRPPHRSFYFAYLHGIRSEDVRKSPDFREVWKGRVLPALEDAAFLAAHHASFDRRVVYESCEHFGIELPQKLFVCTVQLARDFLGIRPANLPNVAAALEIELQHHDPASDAEACARIVIEAAKRGWKPGY